MNEITTELKSHFLRLYQMAFSDDNFDVLEMQMLYKFAEERKVSKKELDTILLSPYHDSSIPNSLELKIEYLYDLAVMIWADEKVTNDEITTLKKYCSKFGFLEENLNELTDFLIENAKRSTSKTELLKQLID
ncbi:hypothetical protein SAMN04487765_2833 [Tenacibaculum sp. MAR_2010_89]|uniref:hypothetical protein n=1 Tax=Tenacibaculum sp. MAR_2010_89 TaxID=1250198 RepID=UPI00089B8C09|nr:hypothetical protein [Tenacibaculum sp. MAR_2010_89]SEE49945.1 hypothetical protein SAMN04487765_2833 [Tenacibaculum sp. MAR_2010_89]